VKALTGFAHLDINTDEFVKMDVEKKIIQGSLSLDDKNEHLDSTWIPPSYYLRMLGTSKATRT
jgi:hypothetical protein